MASLFELTQEMQNIEDELYENGGEITPEMEPALSETKDSLLAKVDNYNGLMGKFEATSKACADEIKRVQGIKKNADNAVKNLKQYILNTMTYCGIERL